MTKLPRARVGTLMLAVALLALVVALVQREVEVQRLRVELQDERSRRLVAEKAARHLTRSVQAAAVGARQAVEPAWEPAPDRP